MNKKKILISAIILLFAGIFGRQIYNSLSPEVNSSGRPQQPAIAVEVLPVRITMIKSIKQLTGSLFPHSRFILAPKIPGRLEKLFVNMGDAVQRNQLIALIDSQEYIQQVEQARAELRVAEASMEESRSSLDAAKREFDRTTALYEKKFISESVRDEAESGYKTRQARYMVALAQVEQRQAALRAAEVRLSFTKIHSSWEGGSDIRLVGERFVDEGTMLRANDPIVSVIDIDSLKALVHVTEEDYAKLHLGHPVALLTDAYPDREFTGKIVRISPVLTESTRTASVEIEVPNPDHLLKPGMFIRAEIELARREGITAVPFSALISREGGQAVFLLDQNENRVRLVPVKTGIVNSELAEISEPELDGYVVVLGQHLLHDGASVVFSDAELKTENEGDIDRDDIISNQPNETGA